jgi:hypothetical protein
LVASRRLAVRCECRADILTAFLHLACALLSSASSDRFETTS